MFYYAITSKHHTLNLLKSTSQVIVFKQSIKDTCIANLSQQLTEIQQTIDDLQMAANNETKSTAGDKHDTTKTVLQQQIEIQKGQLQTVQKTKLLAQALPIKINEKPAIGSLITANNQLYFIGLGLGLKKIGNIEVILLAPNAPLAQFFIKLVPKTTGTFNGKDYCITKII